MLPPDQRATTVEGMVPGGGNVGRPLREGDRVPQREQPRQSVGQVDFARKHDPLPRILQDIDNMGGKSLQIVVLERHQKVVPKQIDMSALYVEVKPRTS